MIENNFRAPFKNMNKNPAAAHHADTHTHLTYFSPRRFEDGLILTIKYFCCG